MGKRKLHNETYFQCDWTGIPMKSTNCFMPSWTPPSRVGDKIIGAKLIKHGSYSCWEAVVAHAALLHKEAPEKLQEIRAYINTIVGCTVEAAPDFTSLAWFSLVAPQFTTAELWMEQVTSDPSDIVAIRIPADGAVNYHEVECKSASIQEKFTDAFPMPVRAPQIAPQRFQLARRKGAKDRDISVFYVPDNNGMPLNATASSLFKMQIYGDALTLLASDGVPILPPTLVLCFECSGQFHGISSYISVRTFSKQLSVEHTVMSSSLQQRTPAWHAARRGKLTASNVGAAIGLCPWTTRQTAFNRAMGNDTFTGNDATRWGTENEPNGILAYSAHTGNMVTNTGLHVHPYTMWLAGSPDGLIGTEGLLEVKCPYWTRKDGKRLHREIPAHYYLQMTLCLEVCQRSWCDFVTWSPDNYKVYRIYRDTELHDSLLPHYLKFFAAMQRQALSPPQQSAEEKAQILEAVTMSMAKQINYTYWDNADLNEAPPEQDDEERPTKVSRSHQSADTLCAGNCLSTK